MDTLVVFQVPHADVPVVAPADQEPLAARQTCVNLVEPLQNRLYRVLRRVDYLNRLVLPDRKFRLVQRAQTENVTRSVYHLCLVLLVDDENLPCL